MFYAKNHLATNSSLILLVLLVLTAFVSTTGCSDVDPKTETQTETGAETGNPQTGNPQTGNPQTGNPQTGNPQEENKKKEFKDLAIEDVIADQKRVCEKSFECKIEGTENQSADVECNKKIPEDERKKAEADMKAALAAAETCNEDECCLMPVLFCFQRCALTLSCDAMKVFTAKDGGGLEKLKADPKYADEMKQIADCTTDCVGGPGYCKDIAKKQFEDSP